MSAQAAIAPRRGSPLRVSRLSYRVNNLALLTGVDLSLETGEVAAISGPTGSGKTTLGLVLADLLPAGIVDADLVGLPRRYWEYLIGQRSFDLFDAPQPVMYIPSNPLDCLIFPSVADELASVGAGERETDRALRQVDLEEVRGYELYQLSGGMLQRLALARVLLRSPLMVIADETHEWLDEPGLKIFREVLEAVTDRGGVGLVLQSTTMQPLQRVATFQSHALRSFELRSGALVSATPNGYTAPWKGCRRRLGHTRAEPILVLDNISKAYRLGTGERKQVLKNATLYGRVGEWIGIQGSNGCGKSVLSRLISGLEDPDLGTFAFNGSRADAKQRRRLAAYLFQFPGLQLPFRRLRHMVNQTFPAALRPVFYQRASLLLPDCQPETSVMGMSPHEQRLVLLSALLIRDPRVLVVDEPTWGADATEVADLLHYLGQSDENRLTIIISHNERLLASVCDRRYQVQKDGSVTELSARAQP
jgi:ABC-type multidrug transport system ATPase subunit